MSVTMKLEGFAELEKELEKISNSAGKGALRRGARKAAQPMADDMASRASRDQGDLADSFAVSTQLSPRQRRAHRKTTQDDKASVELFIGAGPLPQAHLEEFGSIHNAPHPMVRPAWDGGREALLNRLKAELWAEIQKTVRRAEARAAKRARG
ncbi:HK97-gp10 family putative phage morphogenesis protein [Ponticoccus sp. (in: a-proteobacteria)]|uniref:HK97-gp10 family putative phage morphogenesis protein n=1 Tax=Ponticoccus sp. (in: a-proteobacteria) TaxID=1925025 RepID=UPI003AB5B82A